jgi:hypothetical protein
MQAFSGVKRHLVLLVLQAGTSTEGSQAITLRRCALLMGAMHTAHGLYVVLQFDLAVDSEQNADVESVVPSAGPLLTCCAWLRAQL